MQSLTDAPDAGGGSPQGAPPSRHILTKVIAALAGLAAMLTGSIAIAPPANAASGTASFAYGLGGVNNDQYYYVGSLDVGGTNVFCISPGWNSPLGGSDTQGTTTDFGWDPDKVARVNYVASTYHGSTDDDTAAAAQFAIWQTIAPFAWNMHGYSGSDFRAAVVHDLQELGPLSGVGNFATWRINDVADQAVSIYNTTLGVHAGSTTTNYVTGTPTTSTSARTIDATITQSGQTDHFTVTLGTGFEATGVTGTLTLTGATFDATGTATYSGALHDGDTFPVTADHAGPQHIGLSGTATTSIVSTSTSTTTSNVQMWLPLLTVLYNSDSSRQELSYGAGTASYQVTTITTTTNTETRSHNLAAGLDATILFAPKVTTQVGAEWVTEGDRLTDTITPVLMTGSPAWGVDGDAWLPVAFHASIYRTAGPLADGQPIPADADYVGSATLTTTTGSDPTGVPVQVGGPTVDSSGFYVWVWSETIDAQPAATAPYLNPAALPWTDDARAAETSIAPFQPVAATTVPERLAAPGDAIVDQLTVSSANGLWLQLDGAPIPVTFTGTAYQVAGDLPPVDGAGVPASATALGTVTITANGPGVYTSPTVPAPNAGFVTWVWTMQVASQPAGYRPYLAGNWSDDFGAHLETTSVRFPVTITSLVREYNVHSGGRAFDTITVTGFPADHTTFDGDGYWGVDEATITSTVYGPLTEDQLADSLDLASAPVLTTITTPAKNGVYSVGYTPEDEIRPEQPGYSSSSPPSPATTSHSSSTRTSRTTRIRASGSPAKPRRALVQLNRRPSAFPAAPTHRTCSAGPHFRRPVSEGQHKTMSNAREHPGAPGHRWGDEADGCGTGGRDLSIGEVVRMGIPSYPPITVLVVGRATNTHDPVIAYPAGRGTWITSLPDDATVTVVAPSGSPQSLRFAAEMRERTLSIAADELLNRASSIGREATDPDLSR